VTDGEAGGVADVEDGGGGEDGGVDDMSGLPVEVGDSGTR